MARKKYHQSAKDRMHEREGMDRYERRMRKDSRDESEGMKRYEEKDRRGFSYEDNMIHEDRNQMANLPQHAVMREYARFPKGLNGPLNDTMTYNDEMEEDNLKLMKRYRSKDKY